MFEVYDGNSGSKDSDYVVDGGHKSLQNICHGFQRLPSEASIVSQPTFCSEQERCAFRQEITLENRTYLQKEKKITTLENLVHS